MIKIEIDYIYCPLCKKYVKIKTDEVDPVDLMCNECDHIITTVLKEKPA